VQTLFLRAGYDDYPFTVALKDNRSILELLKFLVCRGRKNKKEEEHLLNEEWREQKDQHGNTALQLAIKHSRNILFINWLVNNGANVYTTDNSGDTILHRLITAEVNTEYWTILSNGARSRLLKIRNKKKQTPLLTATHPAYVIWLLQQGADVNVADKQGDSVLHNLAKSSVSSEDWKKNS
jgi:ankyrin repeat protein